MATRQHPGYLWGGTASAAGTGDSFDCTATRSEGMLGWRASGHSAVFEIQASHNEDAWGTVEAYTATATQTGSAQLTGYYPYVRLVRTYSTIMTAPSTATAFLWVWWAPVPL